MLKGKAIMQKDNEVSDFNKEYGAPFTIRSHEEGVEEDMKNLKRVKTFIEPNDPKEPTSPPLQWKRGDILFIFFF